MRQVKLIHSQSVVECKCDEMPQRICCNVPFIKLTSKIVRFPKADVDAYLARNFRGRACGLETGEND